MRKLSPGQGIVCALKADALSLMAWQVGMYSLMAALQFVLFKNVFGRLFAHDRPASMMLHTLSAFSIGWVPRCVNWHRRDCQAKLHN